MIEIENYINKFRLLEYESVLSEKDKKLLDDFYDFVDDSDYKKRKQYLSDFKEIAKAISTKPFITERSDILNFNKAKKKLIDLCHLILEENKKIFIVHGRDINMRDKVEALLGKLRIHSVVLENESNAGFTIIEKFLARTMDCRYAIILLSADDEGGLIGAEAKKRARQNVVLELGFFLGKLGRKRILILHPDDIEIEKPSDFDGIVYLPYDNKGAWKHKVVKELKSAGFYIAENDMNKI